MVLPPRDPLLRERLADYVVGRFLVAIDSLEELARPRLLSIEERRRLRGVRQRVRRGELVP